MSNTGTKRTVPARIYKHVKAFVVSGVYLVVRSWRTVRKSQRVKSAHYRTIGRLDSRLSKRFTAYRKWHQWRWHRFVHGGVVGVYVVLVVIFLAAQISPFKFLPTAVAASWAQSDWSSGQGSSTSDQFADQTNIDFSSTGEIKLASRYAIGAFSGNQLASGSANFNTTAATALSFNVAQDFNNDTYSYNSGTPSRVIVQEAGDYFVSFTQTINSSSSSLRNSVISEVYVNGSKVNVGNGSSSYIRNATHSASSNHLGVLLENLAANDYIEIFVRTGTSNTSNTLSGSFTLYTEKIAAGEAAFSASATQTTAGSNLNSGQAALEWSERRKDGGFTHSNSSNAQNITIDSAGSYFVSVNVPMTSSSQRPNLTGRVLLDGSPVEGGQFQQGYIRNADSHNQASIHWSGIITTTSANQVLTITTEAEAAGGTVTVGSDVATLFVMAAPSDGIYFGKATDNSSGTGWSPGSASDINWATDEIIDTNVFTHDVGSNNHQVTVDKAGDYLLSFNLAASGGGARTSPNVKVFVNGGAVTGAETLTGYVRNASNHGQSSNNLTFPLMGLAAGDVVSMQVSNGGANGTMNDDTPVTMMLWKKGYYANGSLTSNVFNATYTVNWGVLSYITGGSGTIEVKARSDVSSNMATAPDFSTCAPIASGADMSSNNCMNDGDQYVQYQVNFSSQGDTPTLQDITLNYIATDQTPPTTNASNLAMYKSNGGSQISSAAWTNASTPYFTWDAGADNSGGSGLGGYCLYLGQDQNGDPATSKGLLGNSPAPTLGACQFKITTEYIDLSTSGYLQTALTTASGSYYLNVKAIDLAGNVFASDPAQFAFSFDNTKPTNPQFISAPSQFVADKEVELTWNTSGGSAPSDNHSGLAGLQYRIGNSGIWYGDVHNGNQNASDLLANDGSYTTQDPIDFDRLEEGNNIVYFRTWDNAGNVTTAYATAVIKLNTVSPSEVQNIEPSPITNTNNSFAFAWLPPSSFSGSENGLTYCYVFNTLPTQTNCQFTAAGVTSLPADSYATQPGENTIYVVAKDEAGNINYATYGFATFTANTSAPGLAKNTEIADISIKKTSNWKIAMSWEDPDDVGSGVANYLVYRSTDNTNFTNIATTSATSYVDQGLEQKTYYYKVKACDSANNCGALTSSVSMLPTGRYTEPAELITQPTAGEISTRKATIEWITGRTADSRVALGTASGIYGTEEISNSSQVTKHNLKLTSLDPGRTYYYVVRWTDEDGNTGTSAEKSFTTLPPPSIKDVNAVRVNLTSATFAFTSTNAVQVKMYYGKSDGFGGLQTINTSVVESTYNLELTGLDDGTEYFYKFNPLDSDGNEYEGTILSFSTPPRPRISNLRFQPVEGEPTSTQRITWQTNVAATSQVAYGKLGTNGTNVQLSAAVTEHEVIIRGLEDDSEYFIIAQSRDADGNLAVSDQQVFRTALDTRPPELFDIVFESSIRGTGAEARGQVIVSWTTDEPATSQVAFAEGSSTTVFNNRTAEEAQLTTEHIVIVSDLPTSRVYSLQPLSRDRANNLGEGQTDTAIIGRASESVLTTVFNTLQRMFGF